MIRFHDQISSSLTPDDDDMLKEGNNRWFAYGNRERMKEKCFSFEKVKGFVVKRIMEKQIIPGAPKTTKLPCFELQEISTRFLFN